MQGHRENWGAQEAIKKVPIAEAPSTSSNHSGLNVIPSRGRSKGQRLRKDENYL